MEVEELVSKNEDLATKIGQLKETIALQTSECDAKVDEVQRAKKAEVNELKDMLSERESRVLDLEMTAKDLEAQMTSLQSTMDGDTALATSKLEKISTENETLRRAKYELETAMKNLNSERDHIVNLNQDLGLRIVEFEVQVKEMGSQFQSLQVEYEKRGVELTTKQEMVSQGAGSLADLEHSLGEERTRVDNLQVSLNEAETELDELRVSTASLQAEVAVVRELEAANEELNLQVADLTRKNEFLFEEIAKERLRLESKITTLAEHLEQQSQEKQAASADIESLKSENFELAHYKRQVLMLEQEKKDLEAQLVTLTVESRVGNQEHIVAVPEGDGELQGQVDFLNSVIVDMQRKNDKLKAKLELLENAGLLDESVEFYFEGVSARQAADRRAHV